MDVGADSGPKMYDERSPYDRSYVRSSLHRIVKASWKAVTYDIVIPIACIETHPTTSPPGEKSREESFYGLRNGWRVCSADFGCRVNSAAAISRKEAVSSGERRDREWERPCRT
ncbi:unnamed protein product, partial [Heterotrigona itama]